MQDAPWAQTYSLGLINQICKKLVPAGSCEVFLRIGIGLGQKVRGLRILHTCDASGWRIPKFDSTSMLDTSDPATSTICSNSKMYLLKFQNIFVQIAKCILLLVWSTSDPATPFLFTLDIHQKKNTRLKPSYLFKDPVTKRQTKVICIFRVQISHKTHFTSKYVCFPSHCESLVATLRGQAWKLLWVYRSHCASSNFGCV